MLPDLVLQEVHVAVKQGVGGRKNSHRLHPRSSLQLALHRHVSETGQPEVTAFTEISITTSKKKKKSKQGVTEQTRYSKNWTLWCLSGGNGIRT